MNMDVEKVLGLAVQVTILIAAAGAFVVWLRRWLKAQVAEPVLKQVGPNGGENQDTTRQVIEDIQQNIQTVQRGQVELIERIDAHDAVHEQNRKLGERAVEIATKALGVAEHTAQRVDSWLLGKDQK